MLVNAFALLFCSAGFLKNDVSLVAQLLYKYDMSWRQFVSELDFRMLKHF